MALSLTIRARLMLLSGLAVLAVGLLAGLFVMANRVNEQALATLFERNGQTQIQLQRIDNVLLEVRFRAAGVLLEQLPVPGSLNHLRESRKLLGDTWKEVGPKAQSVFVDGEGQQILQQMQQNWKQVEAVLGQLEQAYSAKNSQAIAAVLEDEWPVMVKGVIKPLQTLIPLAQQRSQETYDQVRRSSGVMLSIGLAGAAGCLVLLLVLAWMTMRSILQPLHEVRQSLRQVADGQLSAPLPASRQDELGPMIDALRDMQTALANLVRQVREAAENIEVASSEVATGNTDLSARTEQTASNLQQTAASMEELTSTVNQSADAARQANQLATNAASVASRGGSVVSQVVSTMDGITQSSRRIADIISVIDGIAFQTNILALNAAVEAARAGEQGRGFAVVAGEVRALAQRSADAAKEIKGLIGASVSGVENGARLVDEAGQTMSEIVGAVQRVADIIGEITAATNEQANGIAQVNTAVNQLDQMTQQNAALVEQSAAAAQSLKEQALRLNQLVGTFKVDGLASAARSVSAATPVRKAAPPSSTRAATVPARTLPRAPVPAQATAPASRPQAVTATAEDDWETF